MATEPKIYAKGVNIKTRTIKSNGKTVLALSFNAAKFGEFMREHTNEKGYINIDAYPRDEPDQFGNVFNITLNTWKPEGQSAPSFTPDNVSDDSEIPF